MTELSEHRNKVFLDRYARKDDKGRPIETTLEKMWGRVAASIAETDPDDGIPNTDEYNAFFGILKDFKFVPGGRILAGAGVGTEQTFYNCYVIPVEPKPSTRAYNEGKAVGNDSRESIFDTIATMVDIMSRGGGVGINWSTLRPSGSYLSRVSGTSSGPVGWMDVASKAVGEVEQGGSRRGAAMFMLDDWHPDIINFIEAKEDYAKITNANVSVAISDKFMEAVRNNAGWTLEFPNTSEPAYNTDWDGDLAGWKARGFGTSISRSLPARDIWDAIVKSAHKSGEPGIVFIDRYNKQSTGRDVERIISVNPCGEQGLGAYSVCNLGSMNLAAYVKESDKQPNDGLRPLAEFDWDAFSRDTSVAVRFLDNVIDKSFYWDERSRKRQQDLRRIGLGVMGLADALIGLGIRYGSDDAVKFTEKVFQTMKDTAINTSVQLAQEKGPAKAYNQKMWDRPYLLEYTRRTYNDFFPLLGDLDPRKPLRNIFFLTQAPTGTTSLLAGVNSGIEPYFATGYLRKDRTGEHWVQPKILEDLNTGDETSGDIYPDYVVVANDVKVEEHIAMQAAVQKYVDSSVSKTINGPQSHTVADVDKAYRLAYDSGLKGLAYFRDKSGRDQVLSTAPEPTETEPLGPQLEAALAKVAQLEEAVLVGAKPDEFRRPATVAGVTSRLNTSMGTMYLTVNSDPKTGKPVEVFVNVGKAGSDVMAMGEAIGRLVSLGLQRGIPITKIANQLVGVGGTSSLNPGLVHAIGKSLAEFGYTEPEPDDEEPEYIMGFDPGVPEGDKTVVVYKTKAMGMSTLLPELCPECGSYALVKEEGCSKCQVCGFSKC